MLTGIINDSLVVSRQHTGPVFEHLYSPLTHFRGRSTALDIAFCFQMRIQGMGWMDSFTPANNIKYPILGYIFKKLLASFSLASFKVVIVLATICQKKNSSAGYTSDLLLFYQTLIRILKKNKMLFGKNFWRH